MTTPPLGGDEDEDAGSFFADLMAAEHDPYHWPETTVDGEQLRVVLEVPDDEQVAALDGCRSAMHELDVLTGDPDLLDDLLDVLDARGTSPATAADRLLEHWALDRAPAVGWWELVETINLYGADLEFDVWERTGDDLGPWIRGERDWDLLLRIAARLPLGTHYRSALLDDDDLADRIAEVHGPPHKRRRAHRPPLVGFTPEVAQLHQIGHRLERLEWAIFRAQGGKKATPPKPAKGPETADDRWEMRDHLREHDEVVSQVLKAKGGSKRRKERVPAPEAVRGAVDLSTLADAHHRP